MARGSRSITSICGQVVGRGLRRQSYEVGEDGKFSVEVAKVLGVPFEVVPFKQSGAPPPKKPKQHHVQALPERALYEITFPRVGGYQQAIRNRVVVEWDAIAPVVVDPTVIPDEATMKAFLPANDGRPRLSGPGALEIIGLSAGAGTCACNSTSSASRAGSFAPTSSSRAVRRRRMCCSRRCSRSCSGSYGIAWC